MNQFQHLAAVRRHTAFVLLLLPLGGCGGRGLVPASGKLEIDGKPLGSAVITLLPDGKNLQPAVGRSADDGSFVLKTGNDPGALPGRYKVLIAKDEPAPQGKPPERSEPKMIANADPRELAETMESLSRFPVRSLIPELYASPATTTLSCEVPPQGTASLEFSLTAAP